MFFLARNRAIELATDFEDETRFARTANADRYDKEVLYEAFSEAARAIHKQIEQLCTAVDSQKAADSDHAPLFELHKQISDYFYCLNDDGRASKEHTTKRLVEAFSWTAEQVETERLQSQVDNLLEAVNYRLSIQDLVTALLEQVNIPLPYGCTCKEWNLSAGYRT